MTPPYTLILIPIAAISVTASMLVIFTFILFEEMRSKFFMRIIAFISISDILGNVLYLMLYRPSTGNWFCSLEGFANFTTYPTSWLWTLSLVYHLYGVATTKELPSKLSKRLTHIVCWGLPIVLSVAGLSITRYTENNSLNFEVCEVNITKGAAYYHLVAYYGLLVVVLLAMAFLSYKTKQFEKTHESGSLHPSYTILKDSTRLYPTALVICWVPHLIVYALYRHIKNTQIYELLYFIATVLKVIHGAITASIFFYKSESARRLWRRWIESYGHCLCSKNISRDTLSTFDGREKSITLSLIDKNHSFGDSSSARTSSFMIV